MATQHFKRNLLLNLYREEKKYLVYFFLPLKREKNFWHLQPVSSVWRPLAFLPVTLSLLSSSSICSPCLLNSSEGKKKKNSSVGEESSCSIGDACSVPGLGRSPGGRNGTHFLPKKSHAQSSLVGYSPKGCNGSDMTMHAYNLHGNHTHSCSKIYMFFGMSVTFSPL